MKISKFIFTLFAGASLISSCSVPNSGTKSDAFGYSNNTGRFENKAEVVDNKIQPVQSTGYSATDNAQNVQPVNRATEPTYYEQNAGDATADSQSYIDQNGNAGTVINNYYGYSAPVADNYYDRYYGPYAPGFSISIGVGNYYYRPYYYDNVFWSGYYWPRHNSRIIYYPSYCYSDPFMYDYPNYNYWFWSGCNPYYSNYYYNPYYYDYYHNHNRNHNYYGSHESARNQSSRSFGAGRNSSDRPVGISNTPGSGATNDRRTSGQSGTGSGRIVSGGIQPSKDAGTSSNNRRTISSESVKSTGQAVNVPTNNESNGRRTSTTNSTNTINSNGRTELNPNGRSINSGNSNVVTKSEKVRNSIIKVDGKPVSENNTENTRRVVNNADGRNVNQPERSSQNSQREVRREEPRRAEPQREVRREESTRVSTPRSEPARSEPARSSAPSNSGSSNESNRRR